jgi:effector-binding domain-containing protein
VEVLLNNVGLADVGAPSSQQAKASARQRARITPHSDVHLAEPCELVTLAPRSVLVMRFRSTAADLPRGFFHRYDAMRRYLSEQGQAPLSAPFAIYDNVDGNAADVEAGFVVSSDAQGSGEMLVKQLPGATVAVMVHAGDYSSIEPSYFRLLEWMHELGMERSGRFMETYLNSPMDTPTERLRTQLMVPVGPQSANDG